MTLSFAAATSLEPWNSVVIVRRELPRCFQRFLVPTLLAVLHYFVNANSWTTTKIMKSFLGQLDRQLKWEDRHLLCFMEKELRNFVKLIFLLKNLTAKLQ